MLQTFFKLHSQFIKTQLEYKANFCMMMLSGVLTRVALLAVPFVLYRNVKDIAGWTENEIYLILSFLFLSEGLCNLFFNGIWSLSSLVFSGQMDIILMRPTSPLLQVLTKDIGLQGISIFVLGLFIMVLSLTGMDINGWFLIPLCILVVLAGTVIRLSVYIITNSTVFWFHSDGSNNIPYIIGGVGDFAKYPVDIYPKWMQVILLFIIPFGFIGFVPTLIIKGIRVGVCILALILVSALFLAFACIVFYRGIKKYESVGM